MAESQNSEGHLDDLLDDRLSEALAHKDDKEVRAVLADIGKAELAKGSKKKRVPRGAD